LQVRFLWSSDHHTLHQITPTTHILGNLSKFLWIDHDLAKVNMVVFGGDFMERVVDSPNADNFKIKDWGREFLDKAHEANPDMVVIWLEGTSSHDWGQPRHFLNLAPRGFDVRYIDTLCIQVFEQFDDLSVMYVPDNMGKMTPDDIWDLALKELKSKNMDKVDLIYFHGGFEFQLHAAARHSAHNLDRWESIAEYGIFAGHIHTPVQKGKLWTSGSFDRTAHGEEHPKGGYCVDLDKKTNKFNPVFWENKNALPYVTMKVDKETGAEQLVKDVHEFIAKKKLPLHAQLRIKGGSSEVVNPVMAVLAKDYPYLGFKSDNEVDKGILVDDTMFDSNVYVGVSLTKENLNDSLLPEISDELEAAGISVDEAWAVLEEFT